MSFLPVPPAHPTSIHADASKPAAKVRSTCAVEASRLPDSCTLFRARARREPLALCQNHPRFATCGRLRHLTSVHVEENCGLHFSCTMLCSLRCRAAGKAVERCQQEPTILLAFSAAELGPPLRMSMISSVTSTILSLCRTYPPGRIESEAN